MILFFASSKPSSVLFCVLTIIENVPLKLSKTINSLHSHRLINGISEDLYLSFGSTYLNDS